MGNSANFAEVSTFEPHTLVTSKPISGRHQPKWDMAEKSAKSDRRVSREEVNQTRVDFLKIDLGLALEFTQIALQAHDLKRTNRNRKSARRAYDTIVSLRDRVAQTDEDAQLLIEGLEQLRSDLLKLGEVF
ncbi:MAG TPA: hypothetical protein VKQ11_05000 [Candidatus Sulfotelmatobacter sp.]|nr:hypothetical protein [Candidatus Sulfotelmatobacter sp.]